MAEQPICAVVQSNELANPNRPARTCAALAEWVKTRVCIQVKVHRWSATRSFNLLGTLASLGLAVCVFAWGLQYKLSLYVPPQAASQRIQQAKLLSRNEQPGIAESPLVVRVKTSCGVSYTVLSAAFFAVLLSFGILNPQVSGQREERASRSWHLRRGLFNIYFVRPPPILA